MFEQWTHGISGVKCRSTWTVWWPQRTSNTTGLGMFWHYTHGCILLLLLLLLHTSTWLDILWPLIDIITIRFSLYLHTTYTCVHTQDTLFTFRSLHTVHIEAIPSQTANTPVLGLTSWLVILACNDDCDHSMMSLLSASVLIADERVGVQVKLWNPLRTRAIPECFWVMIHYEEALYQVYGHLLLVLYYAVGHKVLINCPDPQC